MKQHDLGYYFIVMASVVIVLAGIKSASEIIVPFLLSLFLAIILSPSYRFFSKKGLPDALSLTLIMIIFIIVIGLVVKLIGSSIQEFNSNIDFYEQQLSQYYMHLEVISEKYAIALPLNELSSLVSTKQIMIFASSLLKGMGSVFTNGFIILLTVIFMMLESKHFTDKVNFSDKNTIVHIDKIFKQIKEYMVLKALISLVTGLVVWLALVLVGTDYPFLWAVLAFLLNFIPNIGSIIAAVPAVLLTLVQLGSVSAVIVASIYVAINVVIGSVVEPKVMGKGLGLSTLVVFLSLLFWGWLLGPVGMLLSIPLTIMAKIVLDANANTQWIAVLLGTGESVKNK